MDVMKKEIIEEYKQIKNKTDFIIKAAERFDREPSTLRAWWFSKSGFYSIPKEFWKELLEMVKAEPKKGELTKV